MSVEIDPKNPPSLLIYSSDGHTQPSIPGYLLDCERQWAKTTMERHMREPHLYARPMCIVRLKAWK